MSINTGISSHLGAKLRDWADRQAEAGCYSWAPLSSNDSKTRYIKPCKYTWSVSYRLAPSYHLNHQDAAYLMIEQLLLYPG